MRARPTEGLGRKQILERCVTSAALSLVRYNNPEQALRIQASRCGNKQSIFTTCSVLYLEENMEVAKLLSMSGLTSDSGRCWSSDSTLTRAEPIS